jgi:Zn-dependent protease with chaperone function
MATDFFERQSTARRNTKWLLWAFALSVLGILATTFIVASMAVGASEAGHAALASGRPFPWQIPGVATVGAFGLIAGGSLFKIAQLAGGGTVVAERLGGRRLYPNSLEPNERRLLNVVEEMALASGVPVPPVFLLNHEDGINAFAAGFSPSDAVIGVTRGTVDQLSRDQLQGVIAHEFSHILNGDMRLNLRMIGILNGILLLGLVGRELLRFASWGGRGNRRNDPTVYLLLVGLAMMVLGFLGTLLGNLIKAAISRQREFLADASAVQFTRNPDGIAGALKRIGAAIFGSKLTTPRAAEASHMYFAEGISGLFATHPPLAERIRRIDPQWDGRFPKPLSEAAAAALARADSAGFVGEEAALFRPQVPVDVVRNAADQVGNPTETHRRYSAELVAAMPTAIVDAAHDPYGARAVIYASLLDMDPSIRAIQLDMLKQSAEPDVYELTLKLIPEIDHLDVRAYLPLVDMMLPALRALSLSQYQSFTQCFVKLVQADKRLGLFEWTLHQILLRHLRPQFEKVRAPQIIFYGLQRLGGPCSVLLSTLARASQCDDRFAFDAGAALLPDVPLEYLSAERCNLGELQTALEQLAQVAAKQRGRLVDAAAATICADAEVCVEEAELLRGICDMLDCPMPPLLPGERVVARQTVS